ncbi:MAG: glycosyltransferase [Alphaproteobacteria bacterium]|nr:glycosyltransferase [Alphaproteobacteria bacterium]
MSSAVSDEKCPTYSVVVPVLNEAGNIQPLIDEIAVAMASLAGNSNHEIVYVDDGSTDGTTADLGAAVKTNKCLRVFRHAEPCGQSQALITGIDHARSEWIITLDGDGQNDPADIHKLIEARDSAVAAEPGYAERFLYVGYRRRRNDSLARRYQSWLANDIRGWILGDHTPDSGCGLKLFRRGVFLQLPRFNALHRFLPALVIRTGGRVVSVDVSHRPRLRGVSKYGLWRRLGIGIIDLFGVVWLIARSTRPEISEQKDVK